MNQHAKMIGLALIAVLWASLTSAQEQRITPALFEGAAIVGYADRGAYINCVGPAVKYSFSKNAVFLGLLPTLKIKRDNTGDDKPKNSFITPTLGFGVTFIHRHLVLQLPCFYTPKTTVEDGRWQPGAGIGYKF